MGCKPQAFPPQKNQFSLTSQAAFTTTERQYTDQIKTFNKIVKHYQNPGTEFKLKDRFKGCVEKEADSDAYQG